MALRRISFIEARSVGLHIFSKFPIPRLGAVLLATIMRQQGYETKVFIEDIAPVDWSYVEGSDLVCISTITSTAPRALELAKALKGKGIPVVMGGAHPSFLPEESLEYASYVVRQEGDETLPELVAHLERGRPPLEDIRGLSYRRRDGSVVHNPPRALLEDLDTLPRPDFSLVHGLGGMRIYPVATSRGCPFSCRFCSVIQMFGRGYRFRSVETTLQDLRPLRGSSVFFVDDNFAAHRGRTKEILRGMLRERLDITWSAQVRVDVAKDEELLELMGRAGCSTLHIGFESINPETLKAYHKSQDLALIKQCIQKVHEHGIGIHGMFVLGADTDTLKTIRDTASFARSLGIETVQFMMLTPIPGTPVFEELRRAGRLLHTRWQKYDGHHVVFRPALMSPQSLHLETLKAMGRFYSWSYILGNLSRLRFFYAALGLFGKRAVKKALREAREYLAEALAAQPEAGLSSG